jgi:hypothetical protein
LNPRIIDPIVRDVPRRGEKFLSPRLLFLANILLLAHNVDAGENDGDGDGDGDGDRDRDKGEKFLAPTNMTTQRK